MLYALLFGAFVGVTLGLTGGGGSVFAVLLLVYGLGFQFRQAVALSLGIVGLTSLFGALLHRGQGHVLWRIGGLLGLGGIAGVPLGTLLGTYLSDRTSLILFAVLMVYIATRMLFPNRGPSAPPWMQCSVSPVPSARLRSACNMKLLAAGFLTGVLSGMFGVGGGFLLVPALLIVAKASIEQAMATSLVAIVIISLAGFLRNLEALEGIDPTIPAVFLGGAALGMMVGIRVKKRLSARTLQLIFGIAVLGTAIFVLIRNF